MTARFLVRRLSEIPAVPDPGEGEPDWKPLRHYFGLRTFAVNVFVARAANDLLVVEHDETSKDSAGHEELYVVLSGEASFTLDGESLDVSAGTFVAVPDPGVRRAARAKTAGTTLLAIGAAPGAVYEISAWDRRWTSSLPTGATDS